MRRSTHTLLLALLTTLLPGALAAQTDTVHGLRSLPFKPGEELEYAISYGVVPAGVMSMEVGALIEFEGQTAYRFLSNLETNPALSFVYQMASTEEALFDASELYSLRYRRTAVENDKQRDRDYRFDQENHLLVHASGETKPTSERAVDQLSMLYFLRLLPLETGARFTLRNLADPDDNPLGIRVIKEERIKVPAGTFDTYQLELDFQTDSGVFKRGGDNRVWLSADEHHVPVRLASKVGLGEFRAELVEFSAGDTIATAAQ